jgi:hypothetical protein
MRNSAMKLRFWKKMEMLEIKSSTHQIKTSVESINNRLNQAEDRISRIEGKIKKVLYSGSNKKKTN